MRRSTTSAGTDRIRLGLLLLVQLILAGALIGRSPVAPQPTAFQAIPAPARAVPSPSGPPEPYVLADGRTARLIGLGGPVTAPLLSRVAERMADATDAVTAFWGADWPREITVVAAATDEQFRSLVGFGPDTAAATTDERIVFAPGAASMSPAALQIVLRHELFHYAARSVTVADAPRWLTEGVADFVARPRDQPPAEATTLTQLPTDADLDAVGPQRSLAYDRAWWFARYVAHRYGAPALRALYLRACGPGHPDVATAVRETLGADLPEVLDGWRHWRALA